MSLIQHVEPHTHTHIMSNLYKIQRMKNWPDRFIAAPVAFEMLRIIGPHITTQLQNVDRKASSIRNEPYKEWMMQCISLSLNIICGNTAVLSMHMFHLINKIVRLYIYIYIYIYIYNEIFVLVGLFHANYWIF